MTQDVDALIAGALADHRAAQRRRYGHCRIDVRSDVDPASRRIRLSGRVLARRFAGRVAAVVTEAVGPAWTVDASAICGVDPGPWRRIDADPLPLLAVIPTEGRRRILATELRPGDGPVQQLVVHEDWTLVTAHDGTMGWTDEGLGIETTPAPPRGPVTLDRDRFMTEVRAYLGVGYRLGGTTADGIDCSGLVQRALATACGGLVPRHTTDQLAVGPADGPGPDATGTWVFVWASAEAPGHIGVADGGGRVVHASRRRGVVDDARADFLAGASRVRHVPADAVQRLQDRLVGHRMLTEVFVLGQPPR